MKKALNLGVIGIDHGHIFDMLDEMIKEGCSCNYFWTDGDPLTLQEFNKKYPNIKRKENKEEILNDPFIDMILISSIPCLLYTSPSPRDTERSRMPSSA